MQMANFISQLVDGTKYVIIFLDLTVVGASEKIFGNPSESLSSSLPSEVNPKYIGTDCNGFCTHCEQDPCNWSPLWHTIVEAVNTSTAADGAVANKFY